MNSHVQAEPALVSQGSLAPTHTTKKTAPAPVQNLNAEERAWHEKLNRAKLQKAEAIPLKQRIMLLLKGVPMFLSLFVMATAYWIFYLWDRKNYEKRTSHYKLKLHNTWMSYFRPGKVAQWSEWRQSECAHCGACCEILWRCPFLSTDDQGNSHCTVHAKRPLPCRTFPIDPASVELISKKRSADRSCSYRFAVLIDQLIEQQKAEKEMAIPNVADVHADSNTADVTTPGTQPTSSSSPSPEA